MRPSGIAAALRALIRAKQPVFIWSPPGCGKSAVTKQVPAGLKPQLPSLTCYGRRCCLGAIPSSPA